MGFRVINGIAYPVGNFQLPEDSGFSKANNKEKINFNDVLKNEVNKIQSDYTISKHAAERLSNLNFTSEDMKVIGRGFKLAENKGSRNSVMLYKDVALIASIENKTLITAVEKERSKENIFTNVDSVVLL
ncbi:flagellar biosynthesis protein [Caproiciproducens sp. MSJ-32]|uniref:flagellar biosynthesis protein n=1 Tax=Caproiciproducens sp. MSJ-32 TaxID=2841527 RepID=UPI001C0FEA12|nr:flagellar biosynthesis protein [Caproiciproducens sp. MSJ-32]MBU5454784.1 flagellar biosynthesis protein [Caproiciproducens sp. MSJ-32]